MRVQPTAIAPESATQIPMPPAAGFVQAVPVEPYPAFPDSRSPIKRVRWAMGAPVVHRRKGHPPKRHASDKHILTLLAVYADDAGKAWPALATIAADGNLDRATAKRAIARLVVSGWITKRERVRDTSHYWPKSPADQHCRGCWQVLPRGQALCPCCGYENQVLQLIKGAPCPPKYQ